MIIAIISLESSPYHHIYWREVANWGIMLVLINNVDYGMNPMDIIKILRCASMLAAILVFILTFCMPMPNACMLCVPYPKVTIADLLSESDTVILAREAENTPYSLSVVEVLKGTVTDAPIDAFIDSTSRRKLKLNAKDTGVFVKKNSEADWRFIAYADMHYQTFLKEIIQQAKRWEKFNGNAKRINFFATQLNDSDSKIQEQAYLEVGRAPYASIRRIAESVPRERIRDFLVNMRLIEWHSLYILMLGHSPHPDDQAYIRNKLEAASRFGLTINLSAWVTAFIETHPASGIEEIERLYFRNENRTQEELKEVLKGFSVLGSESMLGKDPALVKRQHRIVSSYAALLDNHPLLAGAVARDLTVWRIHALVEPLSEIIDKEPRLDPVDRFAVQYYISMAARFPAIKKNPLNPHRLLK